MWRYDASGSLAPNDAFVLTDEEFSGLYDRLDVSVSGIRPTNGTFSLVREPYSVVGRGGAVYYPGIQGPRASRNVSACEIVHNQYNDSAIIQIAAPDDNGMLTIEVDRIHVGG